MRHLLLRKQRTGKAELDVGDCGHLAFTLTFTPDNAAATAAAGAAATAATAAVAAVSAAASAADGTANDTAPGVPPPTKGGAPAKDTARSAAAVGHAAQVNMTNEDMVDLLTLTLTLTPNPNPNPNPNP